MNFNALGNGAALSAYAGSLLAGQGNSTSAGASTATPGSTALKAAADAALAKASHSFKASNAQHALAQKGTALAADLGNAMRAAGITLTGPVEFSVGADGKLAVGGSDADKKAVGSFLKNDKSQPGYASRVTSLAGQADSLSTTLRQNAAISQAARYAGNPGSVLSLYGSLLQQSDATPAVFTLSGSAGSLTYPGVLASAA
jgi:hypothetical protein